MATEGASFSLLPAPELGSRAAFPELDCRAYLSHAAVSPASVWVVERASRFLADSARRGVEAFPDWVDQRERLRGKLAELIGAEPAEIALMPNTTRGVSDVALGLNWQPGERVLLFEGEFPTNITPWQRAAETFGLELRWLPVDRFRTEPEAALRAVANELERGVRLLAISAVQFQTGLRAPLQELSELCQRYGTELFVDGIQACGAVPLDVQSCQIDYLACGSHKWLMGPEGAGFLYVSARRAASLVPRTAGWLSHEDSLRFLFEGAGQLRYDRPLKRTAEVFEGGMCAGLSLAGLEASLDPLLFLGVGNIFAHLSQYLDALEAELTPLGFESLRSPDQRAQSGILSFRSEKHDVLRVRAKLSELGVVCTAPDGCLRFAPHFPNALSEVPFVADAVRRSL